MLLQIILIKRVFRGVIDAWLIPCRRLKNTVIIHLRKHTFG
ncbi:hypothetical protein HMPREF0658_2123 [Hoylesella marshii DSM 16973 = JCM 13450]|uniref:Uncharacterized protein n=1 Tax=Hoylesella marshii DSM 16973 = JCM 13450 TaxID=862515 RepID=E0NVB8_9BACT|nr:hypothetical protein HMPREF0658_2123 [Hoylesella marshii DSM 16973 = JCM 13450]